MESVLRPCRLWSKFQPCQHNTLGIIKIQKFVKFQFFFIFFFKNQKTHPDGGGRRCFLIIHICKTWEDTMKVVGGFGNVCKKIFCHFFNKKHNLEVIMFNMTYTRHCWLERANFWITK